MVKQSIHPGQILKTKYIEPQQISVKTLADKLDISSKKLSNILKGKQSVSYDLSVILSLFILDRQRNMTRKRFEQGKQVLIHFDCKNLINFVSILIKLAKKEEVNVPKAIHMDNISWTNIL